MTWEIVVWEKENERQNKIILSIILDYYHYSSVGMWRERQSLNYANATRLLSSKPGLFNFTTYRSI